jgi:hypothetical protein
LIIASAFKALCLLDAKKTFPVVIIFVFAGLFIVTVVFVVDKLENIPGDVEVFGIIHPVVVPCIIKVDLIPVNAVAPTVTVVDSVYPRLIVDRLEQLLKALSPILVTLLGIITDIIAVYYY